MLRLLPRIFLFTFCAFVTAAAYSQDTTRPTSVDPDLMALENGKVPKEYNVRSIRVAGINYLDSSIVRSISGLQVGDKIMLPGGDAFSKAISNLWRQRLFSNIQIYITAVSGSDIDLEIEVQERPKLANFYFKGVKKTEAEELQGKAGLVKSTIITENTRRNAVEAITKFYTEKGFKNVQVRIEEKPDASLTNANSLTFFIEKGNKVKVNELNIYGNELVSEMKLKKQMKGTKEMTKLTFHSSDMPSPYGENERLSFSDYVKNWGFLSFNKTKILLDPYFRFKLFSSAKFDEKKYGEDKEKLLAQYNALGYRDAQIESDTMYYNKEGNLNIDVKVSEGRKYYFGNIAWKGNSQYSDSLLNAILAINKGDVYNLETLSK
ncbi:MAG TPA: POTRA domain-containing protein, partial [Chitinophagaceae bacterium]|nr:POTRA domain-containing protein [Chitinophagaceae bacterium]